MMKWFFTHEVHKISIFSHEKFANTKEPFYNTMIKTCTKFLTQKKKNDHLNVQHTIYTQALLEHVT